MIKKNLLLVLLSGFVLSLAPHADAIVIIEQTSSQDSFNTIELRKGGKFSALIEILDELTISLLSLSDILDKLLGTPFLMGLFLVDFSSERKKKWFFVFPIVIAILIGGGIYYLQKQTALLVSPPPSIQTQPVTTTTPAEIDKKDSEIREPVAIFEGEQNRYSVPPFADSIVSKTLGTRYGFTRFPELGGTGGDVWDLTEFQFDPPPLKKIKQFDQFGAIARALTSFSPDNQYLAFRTRWKYGVGEYDFRLMVFDLVGGETIAIIAPSSMKDVLKKDQSLYLEKYEWQDNSIQMIWYPLTPEKVGDDIQLFRTTPKQLWQYDLETKEYTFLREIEE